ncbi:hypothetical protein [Pseudoalteromonas rubra]|uniref:Uncharacterized protein n=1 Tax=Pseudoalteromonas rubra TaxID=43658 RepID=A0A0F4QD13_9GAMM|nr:hypothetical protein [Pseudoalteromonas rubra]KJZ05591.1 hypothetical protein TW77_21950 [Pseudoalteromonas rubra]
MNKPIKHLLPSVISSIIGFLIARQFDALHAWLLDKVPVLNDSGILFIALVPLAACAVVLENKYFWRHFLSLETYADVWGVSMGLQHGFVSLSIF